MGDYEQLKIDEPSKGKLIVSGLNTTTTANSLQCYFQWYGHVCDSVVMRNHRTGRSRGVGYVRFCDPENIARVLEKSPHTLDGRIIETKRCNPRSMQRLSNENLPRVFFAGLPASVTESDLRTFFGRYGNVRKVVITNDEHTQSPTGFGYVTCEDEATVDRVTAERFVTLNDKRVEVKRDVNPETARCEVCMQPTILARNRRFLSEVPPPSTQPEPELMDNEIERAATFHNHTSAMLNSYTVAWVLDQLQQTEYDPIETDRHTSA